MPETVLPRIKSVSATAAPFTLCLTWENGVESQIDVSAIVNRYRTFAPLRISRELFARVRVGDHETDIVWTEDMDMANDTLWRFAQEQAPSRTAAGAA